VVMNRVKKPSAVIVLIAALFLANIASAEIKTFIKEYTYMASDIDSKVSSRAIALEQVKRALLEQLGTYLISETEVKNFQMTKDQITLLTAGIVSAEVIDEKWDGRTYYLRAKIAADPKEVAKSVDTLRTDIQISKELENSKKNAEEAIREIDRLKKELKLVKGNTKQEGDYASAISNLSAADWFDRGKAFTQSQNYMDAIEAFNRAIKLNPKDALAYAGRGIAYYGLGRYQLALSDFSMEIELNPNYAQAYVNRSSVYGALGDYQLALNDANKAIELNPKSAAAYSNRGSAYIKLGENNRGIDNFKRAAQLGQKEAQEYLKSRGIEWQ
jgi:tetratricopeptide (TPR) repeat protein